MELGIEESEAVRTEDDDAGRMCDLGDLGFEFGTGFTRLAESCGDNDRCGDVEAGCLSEYIRNRRRGNRDDDQVGDRSD